MQEERRNPKHFVYAATKTAQTNMILILAWQPTGGDVTFNVIRPGVIETDRNRHVLSNEVYLERHLALIPADRFGAPEDCAGLAVLLRSTEGSYINGAVIAVDGGRRL